MHRYKTILDLGSHSAKLFTRFDGKVELMDVMTWELLEDTTDLKSIEVDLQIMLSKQNSTLQGKNGGAIEAIGTEAMRRSPVLSAYMSEMCRKLGIPYRTISQKEEADLLHKAIADSDIPDNLDVINAGGGSIQIISKKDACQHLIPFGISDLNQSFDLLESPEMRRVTECIEWVAARLPASLNQFAYTGGELTYLRHFSIELAGSFCKKSAFTALAEKLAVLELQKLEASSPFDPKWMRGAIASNCIVLAGLVRANTDTFMATDLNIAHGFLKQV
ncbi:hypothetical protein [Paenibacillus sp. SI8]|uniref:hypothetical protein n=1 Tax=unclassified Paenibacillus TaxID=185978 RepID=UPI003466381C